MNDNCDQTIGPCACGARHTKEEVKMCELVETLRNIHKQGNTRSGKSPESRLAYEVLVRHGIPLE